MLKPITIVKIKEVTKDLPIVRNESINSMMIEFCCQLSENVFLCWGEHKMSETVSSLRIEFKGVIAPSFIKTLKNLKAAIKNYSIH